MIPTEAGRPSDAAMAAADTLVMKYPSDISPRSYGLLRKEIALAIDAALASRGAVNAELERMFPIQVGYSNSTAAPHPHKIPWSIAQLAYSVYARNYGSRQTLERLAERGGFSAGEMDGFLPDWRDRCSEVTALRAQLAAALSRASQQPQQQGAGQPPATTGAEGGRIGDKQSVQNFQWDGSTPRMDGAMVWFRSIDGSEHGWPQFTDHEAMRLVLFLHGSQQRAAESASTEARR